MLPFVALFFSVALARPQEFTTTTTQSPQASFLGLSAAADATLERTIDVNFSCAQRRLGYYADISNDCKVFHICNPTTLADGQQAIMQYSFFCPANTSFDQQSLTCASSTTAPCRESESFYHVNDHIGQDIPTFAGQRPSAPVQQHVVPQQQFTPQQQHSGHVGSQFQQGGHQQTVPQQQQQFVPHEEQHFAPQQQQQQFVPQQQQQHQQFASQSQQFVPQHFEQNFVPQDQVVRQTQQSFRNVPSSQFVGGNNVVRFG